MIYFKNSIAKCQSFLAVWVNPAILKRWERRRKNAGHFGFRFFNYALIFGLTVLVDEIVARGFCLRFQFHRSEKSRICSKLRGG